MYTDFKHVEGGKLKWNSFYLQLEVSGSFVSGLLLLGFLFPTINKISDLHAICYEKACCVSLQVLSSPPPEKKWL